MVTPCSKLWTDINLNVYAKQVINCCKRRQIETPTVEELSDPLFWTERKELVDAKQSWMNTNEFPTGCEACKKHHPNSHYNVRNKWLGEQLPDLTKDHSYNIEIALSTKCNQTCMYCNAEVSSLWAKKLGLPILEPELEWQEAALQSLYTHIENNLSDRDNINYVFMGGETFIVDEFIDVVERLASIHSNRQQRCTMQFISNLNLGPKVIQKFIDLCKKYSDIIFHLNISFENLGERAEAVREGLNFSRLEYNLKWLVSEPAVTKVGVLPTMNALSIVDHTEFLQWIYKTITMHRSINDYDKTWALSKNVITEPIAMHPGILPNNYTKHVDSTIDFINAFPIEQKYVYIDHLKSIRNQIGQLRDIGTLAKAHRWYKRQEQLHNRDYWKIFPELNDIFVDID